MFRKNGDTTKGMNKSLHKSRLKLTDFQYDFSNES